MTVTGRSARPPVWDGEATGVKGKTSLRSRLGPSVTALAAAGSMTAAGLAQEVTVQNDRLVDGGTAAIQAGFIAGESAATWLTAPCDGSIVAVQVFWRSVLGNAPLSIEDSITLFAAGTFPTPGDVLLNSPGSQPVILEAPVMTDGVLNEFRFLDENQAIPLNVPILTGEVFVVSFRFANSPNPVLGPSVVTDLNGCQNLKNTIFANPGGWLNACALGISGDFVIRAVIDCGAGEPMVACCFGPSCLDLSVADCATAGGVALAGGSACATGSLCPIGACCLPDGSCNDGFQALDCTIMGGTFQGAGTLCSLGVDCPPPVGGCCFSGGGCLVLTEAGCGIAGGTWAGALTNCADNNGNGQPDVCEDPCPTDVNGHGATNVLDVINLLLCFGQPAVPGCEDEDVNGDGSVNVLDLIDVLLQFGLPCP